MLPYSPLHHLLLADAGVPLVMTSGNVSDEPIAYERRGRARAARRHRRPLPAARPPDRDAHRRLGRARRRGAAPLLLRRSRGYVPARAPAAGRAAGTLLACGAELKNTFCLAKGDRAWVGHHIGDLENYETLRSFTRRASRTSSACSRSSRRSSRTTCTPSTSRPSTRSSARASSWSACSTTTRTSPRAWPSTASRARRWARSSTAPATARDGTVWGGELLRRRPARLRARRPAVPGAAAGRRRRRPRSRGGWRARGSAEALGERAGAAAGLAGRSTRRAGRRWPSWRAPALASPLTTSAGRLFDAVAALCGIRARGQLRGPGRDRARGGGATRRSAAPTRCRVDRRRPAGARRAPDRARGRARPARGVPVPAVSRALPQRASRPPRPTRVRAARPSRRALGHRRALRRRVPEPRCCWSGPRAALEAGGLRVLVPERLPPNDGGISYGQPAVAAPLAAARGPMFGLDDWIAGGPGRRARCRAPRRPAARPAARVRPGPPGRGLDADRLRPARTARARGPARPRVGAGHALTLALFGLPIVLFERTCPTGSSRGRGRGRAW